MLVDFTRDYCLPCQLMAPWLAELRAETRGEVEVVEVNVDRAENERFALFFGVASVPTQVFLDADGRVASRHEGVATLDELRQTLRRLGWTR